MPDWQKKNKNKNKNNSTALGLSERNDGNSPSSDLSRYLNYLEEIIIAIYQYSGRTDKKAGWYHKHRRDGVCLHDTARLDLGLYTRGKNKHKITYPFSRFSDDMLSFSCYSHDF